MPQIGLILAASLLTAACSGAAATPDDGAPVIEAALDEFDFRPEGTSVPVGQTVTIEARNIGGLPHTWTLLSAGADPEHATDLDPEDILVEVQVDAGAVGAATFVLPEAGTYQVVCSVTGHLEAGMRAEIVATG